jgi:hypothetical protein
MTGRNRRQFLSDAGRLTAAAAAAAWAAPARAWSPRLVGIASGPGKLEIAAEGTPWATYVYRDDKIPRPYFAHVHTLLGAPVTRNHPPVADKDATDHADLHPGLWLAFGDLSGADCWRNKAKVTHERFVDPPRGGYGVGSFAVENQYRSADGTKVIARETSRYTARQAPPLYGGYLLICDSEFRPGDTELSFGDQEEMGLGIRMATPLTVKAGGQITGSGGEVNERQVRGKQLDWCDYSGVAGDDRVGVMLVPDPRNFRRCWFHARDYGLLVANPFAQKSLGCGETSRVVVRPADSLRLRFGVLVHTRRAQYRTDPAFAAKYVLGELAQGPEGVR